MKVFFAVVRWFARLWDRFDRLLCTWGYPVAEWRWWCELYYRSDPSHPCYDINLWAWTEMDNDWKTEYLEKAEIRKAVAHKRNKPLTV
jgi:hypothetical protein